MIAIPAAGWPKPKEKLIRQGPPRRNNPPLSLMALSVCFSPKDSFHNPRCLPGLPIHHFKDDSTYYALAEYFHGPRSFIGIDPYDGGYLQGDQLHDLIQLVEQAGKDLATQPERWLVWTSLLSSKGQGVRIEHHAIKKDVEMTLQTLDEMARQALKNDWALFFVGD